MDASHAAQAAGNDLEHAMRAYEAALAENAPGRHARPDDDDHLQRLRMQVIRLAEPLPSACWPRPVCGHCRGHREVDAATWHQHDAALETIKQRRLCPACWGAGMTLTRQSSANPRPNPAETGSSHRYPQHRTHITGEKTRPHRKPTHTARCPE